MTSQTGFEANGYGLDPSLGKAVSNDVSGATARTPDQVFLGLHLEDDVACDEILSNVVVASQAERVGKSNSWTWRLLLPLVGDASNGWTPCPFTLSKVRLNRMNQ